MGARSEEKLLVQVTKAVRASIEGSWEMAKEIFGDKAEPQHAIEIARLVGDRFMDELELDEEDEEEEDENENEGKHSRRR